MRSLLLVAALLGLVALAAPTAAQPAGDPVPKILEAWKKRQTAFKTVKYVVTGKVRASISPATKTGRRKGPEGATQVASRTAVQSCRPT